jgi:hypothetical protein
LAAGRRLVFGRRRRRDSMSDSNASTARISARSRSIKASFTARAIRVRNFVAMFSFLGSVPPDRCLVA